MILVITPQTCGEAMEVPEMVLMELRPPIQVEVMEEPGAKMSTHCIDGGQQSSRGTAKTGSLSEHLVLCRRGWWPSPRVDFC